MQDPALSEDGPPAPAPRKKIRWRSSRSRLASTPAAPRRRRWPAILAAIVLVWIGFATIYTFLGADRLPGIVVGEATLVPALAKPITFDPAGMVDGERPAPVVNLARGGCDALTIAPEGTGAGAHLNLRAGKGAEPCGSVGPEAIPVPAASGGHGVPLLGEMPLQRVEWTSVVADISEQNAPKTDLPDPTAPGHKQRRVTLSGRGLVLDRAGVVERGGKQRLALAIRTQRLTTLEIGGKSALGCWRLRKALVAATFFQVPSLAQAAVRASGIACIEEWEN